MEDKWLSKWNREEHDIQKEENFKRVDDFLNFTPKRILDIGCGLAKESELFQKKYNAELYLLDGDFDSTKQRARDIRYGEADNFKFYSKVNDLKQSFDNRNIKYTFVDANNIDIEEDIKFDLIYSFLSCGFHYPVTTYYNLIKKHSTKDTICIFDIRRETLDESKIKIVDNIAVHKKYSTLQIELI